MVFRLIAALILSAAALFFFQPVLSVGYLGFWLTLFLVAGLVAVPTTHDEGLFLRVAVFVVAFVVFVLVGIACTWGFFHAASYEAQLGHEVKGDFSSALPPIDIHQSPLVSEDMARRSAEKQLADVPALGSQVDLGALQKQLINGKLYWVSFLQHSSILKWWSTGTTPGYVRVSAVDPTDVALVTEIDGKPIAMRYLPSGYFGDSLDFHLYTHGFASRGVAAATPEVDESGRPFYVVTLYRNTVGFSGAEASGVAIVDPQTGAIQEYALKDVPAWADIVESPDMVADQVANRGEFVHGWWNPSSLDQLRPSGSPDLVYGSDGRAYWYVGMTSAGNDNGLVGFYLIDSRTKAAHRFVISGATEEAAKKAAEGVIPEKHYSATNPLPFVVAGRPTYVFALRDDSGIARAYAMVNIQTFQTLAVGETLPATLRQYEAALSRDPTSSAGLPISVKPMSQSGAITRIAAVVRQGNTFYTLAIDSIPGRILVASADLSDALPLAQVGDRVTVSYATSDTSRVFNLTGFVDPAVLPIQESSSPKEDQALERAAGK